MFVFVLMQVMGAHGTNDDEQGRDEEQEGAEGSMMGGVFFE